MSKLSDYFCVDTKSGNNCDFLSGYDFRKHSTLVDKFILEGIRNSRFRNSTEGAKCQNEICVAVFRLHLFLDILFCRTGELNFHPPPHLGIHYFTFASMPTQSLGLHLLPSPSRPDPGPGFTTSHSRQCL